MASFGYGASDFVSVAKLAWTVYINVHESRANFGKLHLDVESLLVSIGSLDRGHTQELIFDYVDDVDDDSNDGEDRERRRLEVRALREGLNSVIMPFYALFDKTAGGFGSGGDARTPTISTTQRTPVMVFVEGPTTTGDSLAARRERPWRRWTEKSWIKRLFAAFDLKDLAELRSRFVVQASNLNLFLTRLTHSQLQKQTQLLTLKLAEQSILGDNLHYTLDLTEAEEEFRLDIARYVDFIRRGGKPFTDSELRQRRAETRYTGGGGGVGSYERAEKEYESSRRRQRQRQRQSLSRRRSRESEYFYNLNIRDRKSSEDDVISNDGRLNEAVLDDDARLKLAAAKQRLALLDLTADDDDRKERQLQITYGDGGKRSSSRHRVGRSASEQVLSPRARRPQELKRSASTVIVCNVCTRSIPAEKTYYQCETGLCGKKGNSFDVCKMCYDDGENCPGFDKGVCDEMDKVVWKEVD